MLQSHPIKKKKMKPRNPLIWAGVLCLAASLVHAQESNPVEQLKRQLEQMQQNFERTTRAQREENDALKKQLDELRTQISELKTPPAKSGAAPVPSTMLSPSAAAPAVVETTQSPERERWRLGQPIPLLRGQQSYLNLSFDGLLTLGGSTADDIETLQFGDHDPRQRGFTIPSLELVLEGKVDPYFRGQANIVTKIDPQGETGIEAEEAYLETMALPGNFQLKAGQYFTEFGRINPTHPHAWDFVDAPLSQARFLGPDGLRNPGARLSWLMPTPFYSELFLGVQNSHGETAFSFRDSHEDEPLFGRLHGQGRVKTFSDLLFVPRYAASFNVSESQTLLFGASGAFAPNGSGSDTDTQIYGIDLFWKWKPATQSGGFPFVTWQTEAMLRRFQAGASETVDLTDDGILDPVPRETLKDYGFYSQVAYGFRKGWVAALRGDYVDGDEAEYERLYGADADRAARWRVSPNLTWYPSEFSKIRLQYNLDDRSGIGKDHSIWMQLEFLLGTHGAHKF
jgi:hypothetical protein